jgi:hypothetical protein
MAHLNGDSTKRVSIIKEILAEGYSEFTQDILVGAVNNEAQSFTTEIKKAKTAENNGDTAEYKKIVKALLKKYPKDFVEQRLGETIEVEEETEDEDKAVSFYTVDDYYNSILDGDTYSLAEIK